MGGAVPRMVGAPDLSHRRRVIVTLTPLHLERSRQQPRSHQRATARQHSMAPGHRPRAEHVDLVGPSLNKYSHAIADVGTGTLRQSVRDGTLAPSRAPPFANTAWRPGTQWSTIVLKNHHNRYLFLSSCQRCSHARFPSVDSHRAPEYPLLALLTTALLGTQHLALHRRQPQSHNQRSQWPTIGLKGHHNRSLLPIIAGFTDFIHSSARCQRCLTRDFRSVQPS